MHNDVTSAIVAYGNDFLFHAREKERKYSQFRFIVKEIPYFRSALLLNARKVFPEASKYSSPGPFNFSHAFSMSSFFSFCSSCSTYDERRWEQQRIRHHQRSHPHSFFLHLALSSSILPTPSSNEWRKTPLQCTTTTMLMTTSVECYSQSSTNALALYGGATYFDDCCCCCECRKCLQSYSFPATLSASHIMFFCMSVDGGNCWPLL